MLRGEGPQHWRGAGKEGKESRPLCWTGKNYMMNSMASMQYITHQKTVCVCVETNRILLRFINFIITRFSLNKTRTIESSEI